MGVSFGSAMYGQGFWADAFACHSLLKVFFFLFPTRFGDFTKVCLHRLSQYR